MEITKSSGEGWTLGAQCGAWTVGILAYSDEHSKFSSLERHNCTDETFALIHGRATLYVADKSINVTAHDLEKGVVYNVKKGEWHHIVVSRDAIVMVVKSSDTMRENSDYLTLA